VRKVKVGYQLDFRNPPGATLSFRDLYRESLAQVEAAERLGFDSIWLTEHHFTDDGYLPAPPASPSAPTSCWRRSIIR
jgi:alkanesulfonate monooxygenase SsuD/methylene tetrahydromethanopterin reductase-like flavin-dependent oxidoreductase (luciferase family)